MSLAVWGSVATKENLMPVANPFKKELMAQFARATNQGRPHVEVNAVELHRIAGGYNNVETRRLLICCDSMRDLQRPGDEVVFEPETGDGAGLTIRYMLPR
jgi:hypothetical protein